jgi:hypothetical protein
VYYSTIRAQCNHFWSQQQLLSLRHVCRKQEQPLQPLGLKRVALRRRCCCCCCCRRRAFEYSIVSYFLLPTALMRVPLLGSLVAFPAAAMGAHALHELLVRRAVVLEAIEHLQ